jgi:hypothetical protein
MVVGMPFAFTVTAWLNLFVFLLALVLLGWAFIHASMQRRDKFSAMGGLQKLHWLLILGVLFIIALLLRGGAPIFLYIGLGAAAYYLLETRRGLRDVSEGPW